MFRIQSVVGTRGKCWQIVNELGGLVSYVEGTKKKAEAEARKLASGAIRKGEKVLYWHRGCRSWVPALVLAVLPSGRLRLYVNQGGAVPWYLASGVKPAKVVLAPEGTEFSTEVPA